MIEKLKETLISRRKFLKATTLMITGGTAALGGASVLAFQKDKLQLRPPGALDENIFLASCIKCGQCLQVCPPQVVKLAGISQGFGIGTPYIVPREGACILCSGLPCVLACPTGALDHHISLGKDAKMGLAVITHPDTCLSVLGINDLIYQLKNLQEKKVSSSDQFKLIETCTSLIKRLTEDEKKIWQEKFDLKDISDNTLLEGVILLGEADLPWVINFVSSSGQSQTACRICLDECPIKDEKPIVFVRETDSKTGQEVITPSITNTCVGCGVCEQKCPTPIASIEITPRLEWSLKETENNKV